VLEKPYSFTGEANRPDSQLQVGLGATRLVIRQGEKSIEIEENAADGPNTLVYRPDGAAVNNRLRLLLGKTRINSQGTAIAVEDRIPAEYVTKWKSDQLISAITVAVPGEKESRHYEETISLGVDGNLGIRIQRVGTGDSRTLYYKKDQGAQLAFASRR
jgi:hypothetical protein